jgi:hypothetical protein
MPTITIASVDALSAFAEGHSGSTSDPDIKRRCCQTVLTVDTFAWLRER